MADRYASGGEEEVGKGMKDTACRWIEEPPSLVILVPLGIYHLVKVRQ
jgi:hypothetical protein